MIFDQPRVKFKTKKTTFWKISNYFGFYGSFSHNNKYFELNENKNWKYFTDFITKDI